MNEIETARQLLKLGDRQGALRTLAGLIQLNPVNLEAWLLLAQVVEEPAKKADCYNQVLKLDPGNPLATQGLVLLRTARTSPTIPTPPPEEPPSQSKPHIEEPAIQPPEEVSEPVAPIEEPLPEISLPELSSTHTISDLEPEFPPAQEEPIPEVTFIPEAVEISEKRIDEIIPKEEPPVSSPVISAELFAESTAGASPALDGKTRKRLPLALRLLISIIILGALGAAVFFAASMLYQALPTPTPLPPSQPVEPVPTITLRPSWTPLPTNTPYPTLTPIPTNTPLGGGGPLGLIVAYTAQNTLSLWENGSSTSLASVDNTITQLGISPNRQMIAFVRDDSLWVAYRNNQPLSLLVSPSTFPSQDFPRGTSRLLVRSFAWLPDSSRILFNTTLETSTNNPQPALDLWLADLESGEVQRLLQPGEGGDIYPSPDGSQIALVTANNVALASPDGSNRRVMLTFDEVITDSGQNFYPVPVWASDSSRLVAVIPPPDSQSNATAPSVLWDIPVSAATSQRLGEFLTMGGPVMVSPDLSRVLYVLNLDPNLLGGELHLANRDGSNDTILLDGISVRLLGWASDSSGYAYFHGTGTMIYYNNLDTPNESSLLNVPVELQPFLHFYWVSPNAAVVCTGSQWPSELFIVQRDLAAITLVQNAENPILVDTDLESTGD